MAAPATWLRMGAGGMLLAVAVGAFGAHALRGRLSEELLAVFETGARYHAYHALALLALGCWAAQAPSRALDAAGVCFTAGIAVFSGSLYALALTGERRLGAITPIGGLLFMAGWAILFAGAKR